MMMTAMTYPTVLQNPMVYKARLRL
jgi:hypothetical protein